MQPRPSLLHCAAHARCDGEPKRRTLAEPIHTDAMWAEMVAKMASKSQRINGLFAEARRRSGRTVVAELERERARIARELHAGAGQPLAGIKLNLEILAGAAGSLPPGAREAMTRLQNLAESALAEVRAVSHRLHPPDWMALTTAQAIRNLLSDMGAETCFRETRFDIRELPIEPGHSVRLALYRCAQESISNVIRHSGATRLELSLIPDGDQVTLIVIDNGKGMADRGSSGPGMGLSAIREHVAAAGGKCTINSGLDGTKVLVTIPFPED